MASISSGTGRVRRSKSSTAVVFIVGYVMGMATIQLFDAFDNANVNEFLSSDRRALRVQVSDADALAFETDNGLLPSVPQTSSEDSTRDVHVGTMCRCPSGLIPVPGPLVVDDEFDTQVVQPPSLATGIHAKHFIQHSSSEGCRCVERSRMNPSAETTTDMFMKLMRPKCQHLPSPNYQWETMPDLGVEETLPIFVGVLSYESPLSLNATLHNWLDHDFFRRINSRDVFVQLNHRSEIDDLILQEFQQEQQSRGQESPLTALGSPTDNLHPGLAIADMCRRAEAHPSSHPNGENLLMFLEKDWALRDGPGDLPQLRLEKLMRAVNALVQRGVNFIRLKPKTKEVSPDKMWGCSSQGFSFECTTARQHRWSNQPMVLRCDWFLRYLEPFALMNDPIMTGCGQTKTGYCDWEEALQDGRVAWSESQWVVATLAQGDHRMFVHHEVDK